MINSSLPKAFTTAPIWLDSAHSALLSVTAGVAIPIFFSTTLDNDIFKTETGTGTGQYITLKKTGLYRISIHLTQISTKVELKNANNTGIYKAARGSSQETIQIDYYAASAGASYLLMVTPSESGYFYADAIYVWVTVQYFG